MCLHFEDIKDIEVIISKYGKQREARWNVSTAAIERQRDVLLAGAEVLLKTLEAQLCSRLIISELNLIMLLFKSN